MLVYGWFPPDQEDYDEYFSAERGVRVWECVFEPSLDNHLWTPTKTMTELPMGTILADKVWLVSEVGTDSLRGVMNTLSAKGV